ncbi:MAG: sugar ABC transporter permease [Lentisphaeria bacterium]
MKIKREIKEIAVGLGFLMPNILGFLAFTTLPLLISFFLAFSNWNLELHNFFRPDATPQFVGLYNFRKLFQEPDFFRFLGNTLFLMLGIPFGIAGSLGSALLLNHKFRGENRRIWGVAVASSCLLCSCLLLIMLNMPGSTTLLLISGLFAVILLFGSMGGQTVYRTLFYFPHFTAGVATFILWKKLYSPENGPINNALQPILDWISAASANFSTANANLISNLLVLTLLVCNALFIRRALTRWREGESGNISLLVSLLLLTLPAWLAGQQLPLPWQRMVLPTGAILTYLAALWQVKRGKIFLAKADYALADAVIFSSAMLVFSFMMIGLVMLVERLPETQAGGLTPPKWLVDYYWAKPALMLMGLWGALGSNNMLLYLAGLSGISPELYEAADIDGASDWQRFWNITWPQLANVTFFILIMSVIGGLQGGFEMARTMTQGGPAGATTTLSYYIYNQGFNTGRLAYASAVSWVLFLLVLIVTLFNWKFGNRYTND